jgi:serine/threonine protein kinase/Tfp pilus assembly protein PilF
MIGKVVSHYKILEHLGGGGMGVVYKAQDLKLDRPVALKFLPPELTRDPDAKQRFIHEAKAASSLDHPNICNVHDIGETEDGQIFIVMAYYEGATLKKKIDREPLKVDEAIDIATQVARGLSKAHEHGIVHRDIKPANVMVTADGVAKIVDFGLAKLSGWTMLTRGGSTPGTAAYMSPEQAKGEEIDTRTDIWSLGVVLYEMLTGKRPFEAEYENALLYSIINNEPEPLNTVSMPARLDHLVRRCLKKNPADRYEHSSEIAEELTAIRQTLQIPVPARQRLSWRTVLVGSFAFLAVLAASLWLLIPGRDRNAGPGQKSIAVLPFRNLSDDKEDEYFADGLTEDVIAELARIRGIGKVIARTSVMQYKGVDRSVRDIGRELDVATILEGSYRRAGTRVRVVAQLINTGTEDHLWAETYDRELTQIFEIQSSLAREIAKALLAQYSPAQGSQRDERHTESSKAYKLYLKGRHHWNRRTADDLRKATDYFNQAIGEDPLYADAYGGLAIAYAVLSGYTDIPPSETGPRLQAAARKALELNPSLAEPHAALGFFAFFHAGNWSEAKRELERALELSPNDVTASHWYSHYLMSIGRPGDAIARIQREMAMDPLSRDFTTCEGDAYYFARRYDEAIATFQKVLSFDSTDANAHDGIARCYVVTGMYEKAFEQWRKLNRPAVEEWWGAYQKGGTRGFWQKRLEQAFDSSGRLLVDAESVGEMYSQLGLNDRAFAWLEECRKKGYPLRYIKVNPKFDNIRSDPRFASFLKTIGLEE